MRATKKPRFVSRALLGFWLLVGGFNTPITRADDKVLQVKEQDLRTAATQKVDPEYPAVARQIRLTGDVELEISVDLEGVVDKVTVLRGNTLLSGSSMQAIRKWKFNPFRAEGQPVRAVGPIKFSFQM